MRLLAFESSRRDLSFSIVFVRLKSRWSLREGEDERILLVGGGGRKGGGREEGIRRVRCGWSTFGALSHFRFEIRANLFWRGG